MGRVSLHGSRRLRRKIAPNRAGLERPHGSSSWSADPSGRRSGGRHRPYVVARAMAVCGAAVVAGGSRRLASADDRRGAAAGGDDSHRARACGGGRPAREARRRRSGKEELDGSFPTFRKAGQNAPKDPSEALNIEMDGSGFRETIFSSVTKGSGNYSFEVDSEMGTPKLAETISYNDDMPPPPPPPASPPHENGRQHGMVGGTARSWGGQML